MANIELNQALTKEAQAAIIKTDLNCLVRYLPQMTLKTEDDIISFIFRFGMPGLFPNGKWGFTVVGNSGMHVIPDPKKHDHRTSFRYGELPRYEFSLGSLEGVVAPITIYKRENRLNVNDGAIWERIHLAAVKRALPEYWKYLSYSIFKGKHNKTKKNLRDYIAKFIEPADGTTNGYPFYLSDAYGQINLSEVIAKQKIKEHRLKKKLEELNKIIYNDTAKVEAKLGDYVTNKPFIGKSFTKETQKSLAVYFEVRKQLHEILLEGYFDIKYKVDNTKFEGYNCPVTASDIVLVLNRAEWRDALDDFNFFERGTARLGLDFFDGVNVVFNDDMDRNTAVIMHRDLFQF